MARKILLADDSVTAQNMGRKILADAGYEVFTVNNGSAALKKIAEIKPDLIVLDVYMPGYSGLEVCQRLKESHETARTPVLLTVGKLEPFKPDEAKRVRAEGFIVKPFEASELLSALSKLEDKIVPRAESSKQGRFARAMAAVEESGGSEGAFDEDSGWKSRIAFPSKKKKKVEEEDGDDPAIYNAVNRDLRTVVDHGPARKTDAETKPEDRVDVAALGAPGVPRDVSAEEIAAIAAAAAQVQASSAAGPESEEGKTSVSERAVDSQEVATVQEPTLKLPESEKIVEVQSGTPARAVVTDSATEAPPSATFAGTASESTEAREEDDSGIRRSGQSEIRATAVGVLEPNNGNSRNAGSAALSSGSSTGEAAMTMAVGAAAGDSIERRWMAIPVAINPDEAALSLELEMQKAYAALAAAEANSPGFVNPAPEAFVPMQAPAAQTVEEPAPVTAAAEPELAQPANMAVEISAERLGGAVTEIADVAAARAPDGALVEGGQEPAALHQETVSGSEVSEVAPVGSEQEPATPAVQAQEPYHEAEQVPPFVADEGTEEPVVQETCREEPIAGEASAAQGDSAIAGTGDAAEKTESDLAASTAAAWASWRQIREAAQPQASAEGRSSAEREPGSDEASSLAEPAAMAAAAGAEKALEMDDAADPAAIANIVDSVLADLRPKIVEEISRKLGKKK